MFHQTPSKPLEVCAQTNNEQACAAGTSEEPFVGQAAKICSERLWADLARGAAIRAGISVLLLLTAATARAQTSTLYESSRILQHNDLECSGVPNCKSVKAGRHKVAPGATETITVQCPSARPYLVAWDSEQNETILAIVRSRPNLPPPQDGSAPGPDSRLVIAAANDGSTDGHITLFLGCTTSPVAPAVGIMRLRASVPSNAPTYLGNN